MRKNADFTGLIKMLIQAREFSAVAADNRIVVCVDCAGNGSAYWDTADGQHVPESVWSGVDSVVCEFCSCRGEPEDGSYLQKLLNYADIEEEERASILQRWRVGELSIEEIERRVKKSERD